MAKSSQIIKSKLPNLTHFTPLALDITPPKPFHLTLYQLLYNEWCILKLTMVYNYLCQVNLALIL